MAEEVHELVAKVRPEGISQTEDELDQFTETFDETADQAGETAGVLDDFASRWQGAAQVLVAGLGVLAAGLLSKVPILAEVASGLGAILESLGLKLDSVLRPALEPISDLLFGISNAIDSTEGALGTLIGVVTGLGTAFALALGAIQALNMAGLTTLTVSGALSAAWGILVGVATTVVSAILGVVAGITAATAAIAIAIAAILAFAAAYITNFKGVRDKTNEFIGQIIGYFEDLGSKALEELSVLWIKGKAAFTKLATAATTVLSTGFQRAENAVKSAINGILSTIENGVNKAITALNKLPSMDMGTVSLGRLETESVTAPNLSQQMAAIDQRKQQQVSQTRNRFARDRQEVTLTLDSEADKLLAKKMGAGPSNRGR